MKTIEREITPEQARNILEKNTGNRPIREAWVEQLVQIIRDDKWAVTHQGIAIGKEGRLLDGQHRLHAIMRANRAVRVLVTTDMDDELYRWIDGGKSRTLPDRLHLVDNQRVNGYCLAILNNFLRITTHQSVEPTVDDLEDLFLERTDSCIYVGACFQKCVRGVTVAPIGAALMNYHFHSPGKAVEFTEMLLTGTNLAESNPAYALREAAIGERLRSGHERYWKTISACQYHMNGKRMAALYPATEDFDGNEYKALKDRRKRTREKAIAALTPQERSEASRRANMARTPEQRSEISRRGVEARKLKKGA
jgi:hypothetical protein